MMIRTVSSAAPQKQCIEAALGPLRRPQSWFSPFSQRELRAYGHSPGSGSNGTLAYEGYTALGASLLGLGDLIEERSVNTVFTCTCLI